MKLIDRNIDGYSRIQNGITKNCMKLLYMELMNTLIKSDIH